ncbi:pyocin activator PrtN family protein [Vibrio sp. 10N.222.54.F12]|uniref:pyocin activator PrtN family protein n=1 Tax=Vibrio TaxID=662 RepID=UPI00354B81F1
MNIKYALHATYGKPIIPVSEICEEFFGLRIKTANERIRAHTFPIPAFSLTGKKNGDYFINVDELAAHIEKQQAKAKEEWDEVHSTH